MVAYGKCKCGLTAVIPLCCSCAAVQHSTVKPGAEWRHKHQQCFPEQSGGAAASDPHESHGRGGVQAGLSQGVVHQHVQVHAAVDLGEAWPEHAYRRRRDRVSDRAAPRHAETIHQHTAPRTSPHQSLSTGGW